MIPQILKSKWFILSTMILSTVACFGQDYNCAVPAPAYCANNLRAVDNFSVGGNGSFFIDAPNITGGRFYIAPNGTVALGLPSLAYIPSGPIGYRLQVWGQSLFKDNLTIDNSSANHYINFFPASLGNKINFWGDPAIGNSYGLGISGAQLNYRVDLPASSHVFYAGGNNNNGTELMRIKGNGKVGIGTSTPDYPLTVFSSGNGIVHTDGTGVKLGTQITNGVGYIGTTSNHPLGFMANNGGAAMIVHTNGNIGIGTTNPEFPLSFPDQPGEKISLHGHPGHNYGFGVQNALLQIHTDYNFSDIAFGYGSGTGFNELMRIKGNGKVGIGVTNGNPQFPFTVFTGNSGAPGNTNNTGIVQTDGTIIVGTQIAENKAFIGTYSAHPLYFMVNNSNPLMTIATSGNVGIGTTVPGAYKLAVEGKIGAREIEVKTTSWADFVFAKDYKLKNLQEVERYINTHKHLPDMPSEEVVKKDGINLGNMDALLLQKIEELTLYVIDQDKRIKSLEKENASLKENKAK